MRDAKNAGAQDVVLANFLLGYALTVQGAFSDARAHLQEGLEICGPVRDSEVASGRSFGLADRGDIVSRAGLLVRGRGRARARVDRSGEGARATNCSMV